MIFFLFSLILTLFFIYGQINYQIRNFLKIIKPFILTKKIINIFKQKKTVLKNKVNLFNQKILLQSRSFKKIIVNLQICYMINMLGGRKTNQKVGFITKYNENR